MHYTRRSRTHKFEDTMYFHGRKRRCRKGSVCIDLVLVDGCQVLTILDFHRKRGEGREGGEGQRVNALMYRISLAGKLIDRSNRDCSIRCINIFQVFFCFLFSFFYFTHKWALQTWISITKILSDRFRNKIFGYYFSYIFSFSFFPFFLFFLRQINIQKEGNCKMKFNSIYLFCFIHFLFIHLRCKFN